MDREKAGRKFQKELNSGAISIVLLGLLSDAARSMYGYEIAKQLESRSDDGLPMNQGALYPVLRSLEKQSLLSSEVQPSVSGPPRRYYTITKDGREALALWIDAWQRTKRFVDSFLKVPNECNTADSGPNVSRSARA
jgi:PadR family transcriptional regulator PadR